MAEKTFEQAMLELSKLVEELEAGDLPLEKSLKLYEKGVALVSHCNTKLAQAHLKVEELVTEESADV